MADEKKEPTIQEMRDFLTGHERYYVMNSWNGLSTFSRNVKIHKLKDAPANAYEMTQMEEAYDYVNDDMENFKSEHPGYAMTFNGRSNGYIILVREKTNHSIGDDIEGMEDDEIPELYQLVKDFDEACEYCVQDFLYFCRNHEVVEETIMVQKTIRVCKEKGE